MLATKGAIAMRKIYPAIIVVVGTLAACGLLSLSASGVFTPEPVEISREAVFTSYEFTRNVLAGCPTEKAELDEQTQIVTIFFPREEYRDLRERLERQGWQEQGAESGRFTHGNDAIVVERGKLTILPNGLAQR